MFVGLAIYVSHEMEVSFKALDREQAIKKGVHEALRKRIIKAATKLRLHVGIAIKNKPTFNTLLG